MHTKNLPSFEYFNINISDIKLINKLFIYDFEVTSQKYKVDYILEVPIHKFLPFSYKSKLDISDGAVN